MALEIKRIYKDEVIKLKQLFENTSGILEFDPFRNGTMEEFIWEFFNDNYRPSTYIIATDPESNRILGTLAALLIPMKCPDGSICLTIKPEDTLIHIKAIIQHKNRDILKEMYDRIVIENKSLDIKFLWGFTYAVNSFERLGFTQNFSSKQGIYAVNPGPAYQHLVKLNSANKSKQKIQIFGLSLLSFIKRKFQFKSTKGIHYKEIGLNEIDEKLLISFLPENLYSLYLDKYFLDWRIVQNPSELDFSILQFTNHENCIISYLIFSKKNNNVFFIDQFLFDKGLDIKVKKKIIAIALRYFRDEHAVIVRAMGFNHNSVNKEELSLLKSSGFIFLNRGIPFIFKSNDTEIKPEDVYLSRLNTQGIF